jgi:preprotein translocase subunit SecE
MIAKVQSFVLEVVAELKKVSWPTRHEVLEATWLVLLSSAILAVLIGVIDFVLSKIIGVIFR